MRVHAGAFQAGHRSEVDVQGCVPCHTYTGHAPLSRSCAVSYIHRARSTESIMCRVIHNNYTGHVPLRGSSRWTAGSETVVVLTCVCMQVRPWRAIAAS